MKSGPVVLIIALGVLAMPAGASASTVTAAACYVEAEPAIATVAGFDPGAVVHLRGYHVDAAATMDAAGSATIPFTAPLVRGRPIDAQGTIPPVSKPFTLTATEEDGGQPAATTAFRSSDLNFAQSDAQQSPTAARSWYFSGFTPGRPIYGHFRFKGRTRGTFRFGVARGPCGAYERRAPGIFAKGRVSPGTWTVQIDQAPRYSKLTVVTAPDAASTYRPPQGDTRVQVVASARSSAAQAAAASLEGSYRYLGS